MAFSRKSNEHSISSRRSDKMASPVDNLAELLSKLHIESNRKDLLKQVKTVLSNVHPNDLEDICDNLQLTPLFDCLNSDSKEIEIASEALSRLLSPLPPATIFNQYEVELIRGLNHPDSAVKQLVLKQLSRCADDEASNSSLKNVELLVTVVSLLADNDLGVVKYAHLVLTNLTKFEGGLSMLFTAAVLNCLRDVMTQSDVIRYRCYDVIVSICKQSELALHKCVEAGLLAQLIHEIDCNDVLVQLNCLELLSELAMTAHGLQYLDQHGIVRKLENMLQQADSNLLAGFLLPGLFKFFGHVGHLYPKEICNRYRGFVNAIFEATESSDPMLRGIAIQTVGILGDSVEGKFALEKMGPSMKKCLSSIGNGVASGTTETKIKALNATATLVSINDSEQTSETEALLKSWFDCLNPRPAELMMSICRQPFTDLRCAAMAVFKALASQYWGQQYINDLPGFLEYLLDRSTESDKQGKETKYEIIKTLSQSPTSHETIGNTVLQRLKEYVRDGPFFVRVESSVAYEGAE